ncbi:glycerophosphodiester phosphodiesterase [Pedobacter sp. AW31-3R]|uniref:glycerophosphodiester phosphodiesterase n=1 Tax=Pedobacter sp. AW31-3R TaxID=3445781 RepID=UPI003FA0D697
MKRIIISTLIPVMAAITPVFAQQAPSLYLTGYSYSAKNKTVGVIKSMANSRIKSVSLSGPDAAFFELHADTLLLKKMKPEAQYMEVALKAKTAEGTVVKRVKLVNDEFIRNKVIAHRGAWKNTNSPENSIAALNHAIRIGCEGAEFDVHLSSDSVMFVNHDEHIQGLTIEKTDSKQLAGLKLTNGEAFPTLEMYLKEGIKQNKTKLILEIKPSIVSTERVLELTKRVVKLVGDLKAEGWVDYISFDYDVCKELLKLAPYAKVSYLKSDKAPAELVADGMYGLDYHFSVMQKHPEWITEAKAKNLTINVWTVNDEEIMDWLLKENADFITTNEPELLLKKIGK